MVVNEDNTKYLCWPENEDQLRSKLFFGYASDLDMDNGKGTILKQTDNCVVQQVYDRFVGMDYVECWGKFDNGNYFLIRSPLESIQESANISNKFYFFVGIVIIVISGMCVMAVTRRLTKPISELTELSRKMTDLDFEARPGETTAIIGSTGCGKSSLVQLMPRFYDVTGGKITIDGTDIRDVSIESLRENIGYVPQKGVLFSGTIASNIRFGAEDASDEQMKKAAAIAQATDFIEEKDKQYDSSISQGGTNVSGGQKQRLAIARAVARNAKIYIFDDSFSALDFKTDVAVRKALREDMTDSTVFIVAQRVSTILHADQILVLDEGKIVGKGTHKELMENCPVYEQIARSQLSEKEIAASIA